MFCRVRFFPPSSTLNRALPPRSSHRSKLLLSLAIALLASSALASSALASSALASSAEAAPEVESADTAPYVVVLGIAQDAGFPQAGDPDSPVWHDPDLQRLATCLALVDPISGERWMLEATPDFKRQLRRLDVLAPAESRPGLTGIFLTHAHMGHYTGLIHLGREALGSKRVPVYAMPRMEGFLRENGPWDQLVRLENIVLKPLRDGVAVRLNERLTVTPFLVPHRDEYSETVGYRIDGPGRSIFFLPDIDKWEAWDAVGGEESIERQLREVDRAYLDGTFYRNGEIPGRDMAQIPHPFIEESLKRFARLPDAERAKIRFIHFNRTNPILQPEGVPAGDEARGTIREAGFGFAQEMERYDLGAP